jgi:uncharacterized protein
MQFHSSSYTPEPVSRDNRIESLDVLRGAAILGILLINIVGFGLSTGGNFGSKLFSDVTSSNFFAYASVYVLFEGKMRAMFCMLFGAGILLFSINKKSIAPKRVTLLFYLRMSWLVLFGLLHAHLLLWKGDVLFFYGLFGMIVFLMRNMKARYMVMAVPFVTICWFVIGTLFYLDVREKRFAFNDAVKVQQAGTQLSVAQQQSIDDWLEVEKSMLPNETEAQAIAANMRGSYASVASEVRPKAFKAQTKYLLVEMGDNIALMLLGMALLKWGFFTGKWTSRQYRLVMFTGYVVSLPVAVYELWYMANYTSSIPSIIQHLEQTPIPWKTLLYPVQRICMVLAHCAALMLLIRSGYLATVLKRLQAVGQMALSNYIMQTVLCSLFFFGYGLGFFNKLEIHQLYYVVAIILVVQLILSPIWLKYFKFGPMEWLWRTLTYKQFKPGLPKWVISKLPLARVMNK